MALYDGVSAAPLDTPRRVHETFRTPRYACARNVTPMACQRERRLRGESAFHPRCRWLSKHHVDLANSICLCGEDDILFLS